VCFLIRYEYSSIGTVENGMTFRLPTIKNDDNFTYFKLIIINNTGSDYNIDGIYFKVVEGKRKGMKKNEARIEQRMKIEFESPVEGCYSLSKGRARIRYRALHRK